jgi:fluoride exporter
MSSRQLNAYLLVAIGGAIGSVLRYHASSLFGARPLTTFAVNISGSFAIGVLAASVSNPLVRLLLGAGLLGGFTTFSAWQLEAFSASQERAGSPTILAILLGSMVCGYAACWAGYIFTQRVLR